MTSSQGFGAGSASSGPASSSAALPGPPRPPTEGRIWLVRHGATEWSSNGRHTSTTDLPLLPSGESQARALSSVLPSTPALVLSSPLQRARRTAELAGVTGIELDDDLIEWRYGSYEGITTPEIRRTVPNWTIWNGTPPGGESAAEVGERADRVLARACAALPHGDVLLFTHGHYGRVLAARWLELPPDSGRHFVLAPASPCVLGEEHDFPAILRWNLPNPADS